MLFPDDYNFVFDLKEGSIYFLKYWQSQIFHLISFQCFQYGFPENLFSSVKAFQNFFSSVPKFCFKINPIKIVTYLKLMLKQFSKIHPIINFWLKTLSRLFLLSPEKKNVSKHKKNVIYFIFDIVSYRCTVVPRQMLFRKNSPWQILGFNSCSSSPSLLQ